MEAKYDGAVNCARIIGTVCAQQYEELLQGVLTGT
jgi:hypothetical protein